MDHYLNGSGADYALDASIFTENDKVQAQMSVLRKRAAAKGCSSSSSLSSPTFYMPDRSKIDSVFGLYNGRLTISTAPGNDGRCKLRWRAEVPWFWPSYPSLKRKYGDFHAESFPLPNLGCLVLGQQHALFVDNGLGEYLVPLGLARPFLAFSEWEE